MPRFEVEIQGDGLERAMLALNGASIPTIGPAFSGFPGDPKSWNVSRTMHAVLDARNAEVAEGRVKQNLPPDGDYTVRPARPFPPDADADE
jgi:hypothetical protein